MLKTFIYSTLIDFMGFFFSFSSTTFRLLSLLMTDHCLLITVFKECTRSATYGPTGRQIIKTQIIKSK